MGLGTSPGFPRAVLQHSPVGGEARSERRDLWKKASPSLLHDVGRELSCQSRLNRSVASRGSPREKQALVKSLLRRVSLQALRPEASWDLAERLVEKRTRFISWSVRQSGLAPVPDLL